MTCLDLANIFRCVYDIQRFWMNNSVDMTVFHAVLSISLSLSQSITKRPTSFPYFVKLNWTIFAQLSIRRPTKYLVFADKLQSWRRTSLRLMDFSVPIHQRRYEMLFVCLVFDVLFLTETAPRTQFKWFQKMCKYLFVQCKNTEKKLLLFCLWHFYLLFSATKVKQKPFNLERSVLFYLNMNTFGCMQSASLLSSIYPHLWQNYNGIIRDRYNMSKLRERIARPYTKRAPHRHSTDSTEMKRNKWDGTSGVNTDTSTAKCLRWQLVMREVLLMKKIWDHCLLQVILLSKHSLAFACITFDIIADIRKYQCETINE